MARNRTIARRGAVGNYNNQAHPDAVYEDGMLAYSPVSFYDASLSDVWQDSARTTPAVADADVLGCVDDLSGNGYHITQGTTANKPILKLNILNGKPVMRFDGTDILAKTSFPDFGDTYTAYAVAKYATSADSSQGIFNVGTNAINTGFGLFHDSAGKAHTRDASTNRNVVGADIRNDSWKLHAFNNSGSLVSYWQNAVSIGTSAYTAPNPSTLHTLSVGAMDTVGTFVLIGDIAMLAIFNTSHDAATRQAIEALLNERFAVY